MDYRVESNTQWDFADFILYPCEQVFLLPQDYMILDNCTLHSASESLQLVKEILEIAGLTMVFLPTYSLELNPCELVFNVVNQ